MTKKQFLAMSLPYKLSVISKHGNSIGYLTAVSGDADFIFRTVRVGGREKEMIHIDNTLPIIRPLSDLTKEIEHNGEKFIPVLKLLEANSFDINENTLELIEKYKGIYFDIDLLSLSDALLLIEWHFDICGLIEKGEAIDVNTLDKNPYK